MRLILGASSVQTGTALQRVTRDAMSQPGYALSCSQLEHSAAIKLTRAQLSHLQDFSLMNDRNMRSLARADR